MPSTSAHLLVHGGHAAVVACAALGPVADLAVGEALGLQARRGRRDVAQDVQLEVQRVVGGGGRQGNAGHLLAGMNG